MSYRNTVLQEDHYVEVGNAAYIAATSIDNGARDISEVIFEKLDNFGYSIVKNETASQEPQKWPFEIGQMVECCGEENGHFKDFFGEQVEVIGFANKGNRVVVTAHHRTKGFISLYSHGFQSIRTEKEKTIEKAWQTYLHNEFATLSSLATEPALQGALNDLYDAGMLKLPEGEQ